MNVITLIINYRVHILQVLFTVLDLLCDIIYILDIVFESKTSFLDDGCVVSYQLSRTAISSVFTYNLNFTFKC